MGFWFSQGIQRRLLLYLLQQISLFSNLDLSNLDVSLGTNSKFTFNEIDLSVDDLNIPFIRVKSGKVGNLTLQLTVNGGVDIKGLDIHFVVSIITPQTEQSVDDDDGSLVPQLLAKSIHDLTTSMIQFTTVPKNKGFKFDDISDLIEEEEDEDIKKIEINTMEPDYGNSILDQELPPESKPTRLQSMKNKVLNTVLSKLAMTLQNITFTIVDENDKSIFEVTLDNVQVLSKNMTVRQIIIDGINLNHITHDQNDVTKSTDTKSTDTKSEDSGSSISDPMTESMYYSKLEGTSIYMSALETPLDRENNDISSTESTKKSDPAISKEEIFHVDNVNISFQGLSTVDDLSIRNLTIDVDYTKINIGKITIIHNEVLNSIVQHILLNQNVARDIKYTKQEETGLKETEESLAYKRFRNDQQLHTLNFLSYACFDRISIILTKDTKLNIKQVYINQLENQDYIINLDSLNFDGEGIIFGKTDKPLMTMKLKTEDAILNFPSALNLSMTPERLAIFTDLFYNTQNFVSSLLSNRVRKRIFKETKPEFRKLTVNTEDISISLIFDNYKLSLLFDPIYYTSETNCVSTNSIGLIRHNNKSVSELLTLSFVKFTCFKTKVQQISFNDTFNDLLLNSHNICSIKTIIFKDNLESLEKLYKDVMDSYYLLSSSSKTKKNSTYRSSKNLKVSKYANMKKSVRILSCSSIIYKQSTIASVIVLLDSIKWKIDNVLKNSSFGSIKGRHTGSLFALTGVCNDIVFHSNDFSIDRIYYNKKRKQSVVSPIDINDLSRPVLFIQKKSNSKFSQIKTIFRNISINYYASWLVILNEFTSSGTQPTKMDEMRENILIPAERTNYSIDIRFFDSSIILHPYRLKANIILTLDQFTNNFNIEKKELKGTLKSGTLLLIDDIGNKKEIRSNKQIQSLLSFYSQQGYSAIGRIEIAKLSLNTIKSILNLDLEVDHISLSLCADSFHTFTQVGIDLKLAETFPDDEKFKIQLSETIDVFNDVNVDYFDFETREASKLNTDSTRSETVDIVDDFLDKSNLIDDEAGSLYTHSTNHTDFGGSSIGNDESIQFHENYINTIKDSIEEQEYSGEELQLPDVIKGLGEQLIRMKINLKVHDTSVKMFDGFDWKYSRRLINRTIDTIGEEIELMNSIQLPDNNDKVPELLQKSVFESIYISTERKDFSSLKKIVNDNIQGRVEETKDDKNKLNLYPSKKYRIFIKLEAINFNLNNYIVDEPTIEESDNSTDILTSCSCSIRKFEIIDNVPTSTWNKFLTLLQHENWSNASEMCKFHFTLVRPVDYLQATESILDIKLAPLRLHVDQDTLEFLTRFLEFKDTRFELIDKYPEDVFFQKFSLAPVKVKLDYKPKKVDYSGLRSGHTSEFMNFFILDGVSITLKNILMYGVNGFKELGEKLKETWTPDISKKQLGGVLGGIAPLKSFITLGSGVKSFVTVLLSEYQTGGNMTTSLKRNGNVFLKTTTGDFVKLSVRMATGTQAMLETTEEMLGGQGASGRMYDSNKIEVTTDSIDFDKLILEDQLVGGSNPRVKGHAPSALIIEPAKEGDVDGQPKIISLYADQPLDVHKGLEEAYNSLEKHLYIAYDTIWKTRGDIERNETGGARAAAISVMKAAPVAIIRPLIGVTEAVSKTLQGLSNQIDKKNIQEVQDKYKSRK